MRSRKPQRKRGVDPRYVTVEKVIRERPIAPDAPKSKPAPVHTDGRTYRTEPFSEREIRR